MPHCASVPPLTGRRYAGCFKIGRAARTGSDDDAPEQIYFMAKRRRLPLARPATNSTLARHDQPVYIMPPGGLDDVTGRGGRYAGSTESRYDFFIPHTPLTMMLCASLSERHA